MRAGSYLCDLRLIYTVPILQRCLGVSLQKIDRPEKVVAVGIVEDRGGGALAQNNEPLADSASV